MQICVAAFDYHSEVIFPQRKPAWVTNAHQSDSSFFPDSPCHSVAEPSLHQGRPSNYQHRLPADVGGRRPCLRVRKPQGQLHHTPQRADSVHEMKPVSFCCLVVGRHARHAHGELAGRKIERSIVMSGAPFGLLCWASGARFASCILA